jgi:hypothetical protein
MVDEQFEPAVAMQRVIQEDEAIVNITWKGQNGDLPDPVHMDLTDGDLKQMVTEAVRGGFPGVDADPAADFGNFVVDRFGPKPEDNITHNRIMIRPKTEFGSEITDMTDDELKKEFSELFENAKKMTSNEKDALSTLQMSEHAHMVVLEIVTRFIRS